MVKADRLKSEEPVKLRQHVEKLFVSQSAEQSPLQQEYLALLKLLYLSEKSLHQRGEISFDEAFEL
jgi:hypothetical protein